jgi:hypothetical protein
VEHPEAANRPQLVVKQRFAEGDGTAAEMHENRIDAGMGTDLRPPISSPRCIYQHYRNPEDRQHNC